MHLKHELTLKQYKKTSEYLKNQTWCNIETNKHVEPIGQIPSYLLKHKLIYLLMC